jgi:hypothetical protein
MIGRQGLGWRTLILVAMFGAIASPVAAAQKVAVFPFDLRDISQEGEIVPRLEPEDLRRLVVVADELKALLGKDDRYEVIDLTPFAAEVEAASPFDRCNACEVELGKKAGADLAVTGFVDKLSDALISLQLFARDTTTGELKKSMSAEIRGNTDELWLHGIRWLWRNRFNPETK